MKPVTEPILLAAANAFDFGGPVVCDGRHYGEGHINDTYLVWRADHSKRFILQRINTDTFTDPVGLMENVCGVTRHLSRKILAEGGDPMRETLNVVPTLSGSTCYLDAEGGAWRAYDFVEGTVCLQQVGSEGDFRTVAETLGKFQNQLADYPASTLHETIARFHDTANRYANFEKALAADSMGRAAKIAEEIAFVRAREADCHVLLDQLAAGEIPLRVTHNDTKIRNKNKDAVIILRTPTPMWNTGSREANIPQYIAKMKQVADEQNLIYIDQYTELQKAFNDYGWLKKDTVLFGNNLHPGANGHLLMTRHFLKGCGLWKEDSAIANLFYEMPINEKTSEITPEVIKTPNRIGVSLEKLKEDSKSQIGAVHLKAVSKASGQTYETDAEAGEKLIVLKNLPENQKYEVEVSAWLKDRAEKTVFQKQEIELNNTLEEAFDICLSDEKVENLNEGTTVGTFTVNEMAPEGNYVFSLCTGEGDTHNPYFAIENGVLKTAKKLEEGKTYTIRLKAKNAEAEKEKIFKIYAVGRGLVFRKEDQKIAVGSPVELSTKDYAEKLMKLEEGTILVHYTSTSDQAIQSLFSVSNAKAGHENRHFHVYIRPEGVLGCEIRNESAMNYGFKAANAVKADYKGKPAENIIALQADKEKGTYQLFANGEKVLTVDAAALGGYRFISEITGLDTVSLGATKRGGINKYTFGGNIHKIEVYETPLTDEELIEETKKTAYPELQQIFHKNDGTGANYYRIPALLTLKSGTVISAADARFGGTHDSPNNIDIAVARSEDGGKNWSKPELPFHYEDYEDNTLEIPVGTQTRVNQSASFIDPVLLQDEETERVFLISDAMAAGYGSPQAVTGSGYKEIQGKKYLKLQKAGETDYNYTVRENGVIYNDTTNQPTEYSLNSNFEILKDNVLQTVKQKSSRFDPTNGSGQLVTDETDKDVPMNIMYADAVFKALPTTWLYMKYSDDDGKTWSDPILLNGMVKAEDSRVLVTGPGRGMQIKNGEYKGRLIVPVYDTAQSGIIYSDDHGATWNYAKGPSTKKAAMSESQIVEMPDGTLRVYARSTGSKIAEAVSLDGGKTWTEAAYVPGMTQPGWGSQLSVIRYGGLIEGKPALIMSTPAGVGNYRRDGRVKIGLITDTGKEGSEKYKIDWTYDYSVDSKNAGFAYSCLSELPNHQIGLMYEKYDSYNPAELHSQDIMKYEELSLSELMGKEVVEIIPQTEGKGTVSQRNTVKKGSKITIEAYPEEGYQFVRWEDEKGNPVSEQEKYTFDAKESAAFTAVFEQEKDEVDKSHLKEAIRHAEEQMQDEKYQDVIPVVREEYEEAYKNAKAIDEKPDATSEEVETAYKTLIEVGKRLTMYKGDLTELQAAYDLYAGKDLSIYTQDSKTVLEEALKEAEKVLKLGENAVKEDVNEALEKLQKAIEGLEKSEPNPPTDPEFPTDPDSGNTDIVNPDNSLSPDDTPSTNGTPSASDEKAVATGDKETPVGWTTLGFAAMLAAAGRFLGRKKRR